MSSGVRAWTLPLLGEARSELERAATLAYHRRWWALLSVAQQRCIAASLLYDPGMAGSPGTGVESPLMEVLRCASELLAFSRLPLCLI